MLLEYRVEKPGHIHAGKELKIGEIILINQSTAERFPETFSRVAQKSVPSATRSSSGTKSFNKSED